MGRRSKQSSPAGLSEAPAAASSAAPASNSAASRAAQSPRALSEPPPVALHALLEGARLQAVLASCGASSHGVAEGLGLRGRPRGELQEEARAQVERTLEDHRREVERVLADHASQLRGLWEELGRRRPSADDAAAGALPPVLEQSRVELRAQVEEVGSGVQQPRRCNGAAGEPTTAKGSNELVEVLDPSTGSRRTSADSEHFVKVTPEMVDCSEIYSLRESAWDVMFLFGSSAVGRVNSFINCVVFLINFALQVTFIVLIRELLVEHPALDADVLDGLLKFRLGLAHQVDYADTVTQRSMAAQLCSFDNKLHLAGEQVAMYDNLAKFYTGGTKSKALVFFTQILWICTIMADIENTFCILLAVNHVKTARRTLVAWVDRREEDPVTNSGTMLADSGIDTIQADGFMSGFRVLSITRKRKVAIALCVCLPKLVLAVVLYVIGALWLANTIDFTELVLNGVALAFVLDFDEVLYSILVPRRSQTLITHLDPLPYQVSNPGSPWKAKRSLTNAAVIVMTMLILYFAVEEQRFWELDQGHKILCSGITDFVYTVNPASGMVHIAKTTGDNSYTDTEEIIAQVAHVDLQDHDYWKGLVGQDIFDASTSDFARAVTESGSDPFGRIVDLSLMTLADATYYLPCRDLASGQSAEASLETLRELTQDPTVNSCRDVPPDNCAYQNSSWLRAICPRRCRCEDTVLTNTGFFQSPEWGCPSQCETFKAAKNEISFRFELTKVDTGSARRLQSAAGGPRPPARAEAASLPTGGAESDRTWSEAGQSSGPAGRRLTSVAQCADFASTDFGFHGGCADSNGETDLDRNGNDCSVYDSSPLECGQADDDDFVAAQLCCSCGGGIADVPSSADCYDNFRRVCWDMPWKALTWLLWVRGLFEYSLSRSGFAGNVANVVETDYAGIAPDNQTASDLHEYIANGSLGRALASGSWDLMPGLGHPRNLSGCDFLVSYEITSLLNIDLCTSGGPIKFICPSACGCSPSNGLAECPAACIFTECLEGLEAESCGHVHPWFSSECIAGFHNDNGMPTCLKCIGGETRRRRSTSCTDCADGFYDVGNADDCTQCSDGYTRRRRSTSCTDCDVGRYDAGDSDDCTQCVGGATTRRRSTTCTDCPNATWNSGAWDDCQSTASCETRRRRSSKCLDCQPGYYNDGSSDDCSQCEGGETRRRRDAVSCTVCPNGTYNDGDYDECLPVACPNHSSGDSVAAGCKCDTGYLGQIRPTSHAPYYSGACTELTFYDIDTLWCHIEILDVDLCAFGARRLGLSADESAVENTGIQKIYGCSVRLESAVVAPIGNFPCSNPGRCVCLGNESDFICSDEMDTIDSDGNSTCPPIHDDDTEEEWKASCIQGEGLARPEQCCSCKQGGVLTKKPYPTCNDTNGEATSEAYALAGVGGCIQWDWFPSKCQWSSYYDDDDFTAADMCCACGGGNAR